MQPMPIWYRLLYNYPRRKKGYSNVKQATRLGVAGCMRYHHQLQLQSHGDVDDRTEVRSEGAKLARQGGDDLLDLPQRLARQRAVQLRSRIDGRAVRQEIVEFPQGGDEVACYVRRRRAFVVGWIEEVTESHITNSIHRHRGVQHI